jgi:anti-sigma factor RsiW
MSDRIPELDLHAWVDARLAPAEEERVRRLLHADPRAAQTAAAYRTQNERLKSAYDRVLAEPVPERLRAVVDRPRPLLRIAAAAAWLAFGAAGGWYLHDALAPSTTVEPDSIAIARPAISAHAVYEPEVRHPVEVGAEQERHLVGWLSKRLDHPLLAPDLSGRGFELVGGRLLPVSGHPAAQLMYEDDSGKRITLYASRPPRSSTETAFRYHETGGVGAFYWVDDGLGYALVGRLDRTALLGLAEVVYLQMNP